MESYPTAVPREAAAMAVMVAPLRTAPAAIAGIPIATPTREALAISRRKVFVIMVPGPRGAHVPPTRTHKQAAPQGTSRYRMKTGAGIVAGSRPGRQDPTASIPVTP